MTDPRGHESADRQSTEVGDLYERLDWDARKCPIPEYVMDVKTKEGLEEARTLVNHAIIQGWTKAAELARRTGIEARDISEFRNKKWKGKAGREATVASDLAKAINAILRAREAEETQLGGFVNIRIAEEIYNIVQYTIKRRKIAAFFVPAGLGKTMTLNQLDIETPGSMLLTVTRSRGSVKSFLQLWARALGLEEVGRAEDIQESIIADLRGTDRLVLIDEAHKLQVNTLDVIREVWDAARIPIVMAATPSFRQTITSRRAGTRRRELMDQLSSRVGIFRDLSTLENPQTGEPEPVIAPEDIRKIFQRGKVRIARDGIDFLCKLANTSGAGGLRVCADLVQMVVDLFATQHVTADHLREALKAKLGVTEAGFSMDYADIETEVPATATG